MTRDLQDVAGFLASLAALMLLIWTAVSNGLAYSQLSRDGIETTGRITSIEVRHSRNSTSYETAFVYDDHEGTRQTGVQSLPYRLGREGSATSVTYSRSQPDVSALDMSALGNSWSIAGFVGLFLVAPLTGWFGWCTWKIIEGHLPVRSTGGSQAALARTRREQHLR